MVGAADQVQPVGAEPFGLQLLGVGADGGQRQVGLARGHLGDARFGQQVRHLQLYARMARMEQRQHGRQPGCRQRRQQGDGHAPALQRRRLAQAVHGIAQVGAYALRGIEELRPLLRQRHMARAAVEQAHAHAVFQALDQGAEGRLRQMAALRGQGEAAELGQGDEGIELAGGDIHRVFG